MIQEEIEHGQRIRSYTVSAQAPGSAVWAPVSQGLSVGNKRIDLLPKPIMAAALMLTIEANQATPIFVKNFAAFTGKGC